MEHIRYHSTNRHLTSTVTPPVTFKDALFMGLARDEGLFMPKQIPRISHHELNRLKGKSYPEVAFSILKKFLWGELSDETLYTILHQIYTFDLPFESLGEKTFLVRLDRGPTASFKDFAAQFMARIMSHLKPEKQDMTILVATSGDTGSAVGEAFRDLRGFKVYIVYPENEVSQIQKHHLTSIGNNVCAIAIDGKFDDCQALVKQALVDPSLSSLHATSANSINIGRILPQIVYYVYAFCNLPKDFNDPIIFSIPSGNFGNSLGCELARRMGLPVKKIIIAVNENDEFPNFLTTGYYQTISPSRNCLSNAMNVGNPSNLARYFDLYGGCMTRDGTIHHLPDIKSMKHYLSSISVSDTETVHAILDTYKNYHLVVEPHGAVAIFALQKYRENHNMEPAICLETAHHAKFPEVMENLLHQEINPPPSFEKFDKRDSKFIKLENDYSVFKSFLLGNGLYEAG